MCMTIVADLHLGTIRSRIHTVYGTLKPELKMRLTAGDA